MPKKPFLAVALFTLILGISIKGQAAVNPELAALAQGSVVQFTGFECISQPLVFEIDLTVAHPALNFANVVRQPLQVTVARGKTVAGMVERIEQLGAAGHQD